MITEREREIMQHAVAWKHKNRLYRNHFAVGPDDDDWTTIQVLCERGLMCVLRSPSEISPLTIFTVTALGIDSLKGLDW